MIIMQRKIPTWSAGQGIQNVSWIGLLWITCPFQVGPTYLVTFTPFTNHVKGTKEIQGTSQCLPPKIGVLGVPIHFGMYPNIGTHKNMWLSCHTRHQLINWDEATHLPEDDRGLIYELGTSQHPKTPSSGTVNELPKAKELSSNPGQMAMCTKTPSWHHVFDGVKR